jgi:hypothetical protein
VNRPGLALVLCVAGCAPSVEVAVGAGQQAAGQRALSVLLGPTAAVRPGPTGGLLVDAEHAGSARAALASLGLMQPRAAEAPRLVVGPTEAGARAERQALQAAEDALRLRPGVVGAAVTPGSTSAVVTLWLGPDADRAAGAEACRLAREILGASTPCEPQPFTLAAAESLAGRGSGPETRWALWASAACLVLSMGLAGLAWQARATRERT